MIHVQFANNFYTTIACSFLIKHDKTVISTKKILVPKKNNKIIFGSFEIGQFLGHFFSLVTKGQWHLYLVRHKIFIELFLGI